MPVKKSHRSLLISSAFTLGAICICISWAIVASATPNYGDPPVYALRAEAGEPLMVDVVFQTEMAGKTLTCGGLIKGTYISGKLKFIGEDTFFVPRSAQVIALKTKLRSLEDSEARSLLKQKMQRVARMVREENRSCAQGPGGAPPAAGTATPEATPTTGPGFTPSNTPTPRATATSTPTVTPTATPITDPSIQRGKVIYDTNCARCHRLGSYDTTGPNSDLKGKAANINPARLQASFGIVLTPQDVIDITNFINSQ